jgi:hypothetical protein
MSQHCSQTFVVGEQRHPHVHILIPQPDGLQLLQLLEQGTEM